MSALALYNYYFRITYRSDDVHKIDGRIYTKCQARSAVSSKVCNQHTERETRL